MYFRTIEYNEGYNGYFDGLDNPYDSDSDKWIEWDNGYNQAGEDD